MASEARGSLGRSSGSRKSGQPCRRRPRPSLPPPASRWSLDSVPCAAPGRSLPGAPRPLARPGVWAGRGPGRGGLGPAGPVAPGAAARPPERSSGPALAPTSRMEGTRAVASGCARQRAARLASGPLGCDFCYPPPRGTEILGKGG